MLHTALEVIAFNINRKNSNLRFFEFGKTYSTSGTGQYHEAEHLCLYLTGQLEEQHWKKKNPSADIYYIKGVCEAIMSGFGIAGQFNASSTSELPSALSMEMNGDKLLELGRVHPALASKFDIKQPVFFADFYWDRILQLAGKTVQYKEISRYPSVERDLAMVVPSTMKYGEIETRIEKLRLANLRGIKLFDVFESEKLGAGKKSMAVNLVFQDEEKTLTDKEIDGWMNKIMFILEKELNAEIRK